MQANRPAATSRRGNETRTGDTKITTLREYNNEIKPITYLWIAGVGCPAGAEYRHWDQQPDGSADEDYCDVTEVIDTLGLWSLTGTIDDDGRWEWDGTGDPSDQRGNKIHNVKAI